MSERDGTPQDGSRRDVLPDTEGRREPAEAPVDGVVLSEEQRRRRRSRSVAIAVVLGALCVLFYVVTIVKLGPAVLIRPL